MQSAVKRLVSYLPTSWVYHIHNLSHRFTGAKANPQQAAYVRDWPDPPRVVAGPFKGLIFTRTTFSSSLVPSLLGTYELEVHDAIEVLCKYQPDVLADIGAGEGYYAVGMALRVPAVNVLAYEMFKPANYILGRVAAANGVGDRVSRPGICTIKKLHTGLLRAKRPAVICDCEGAEDLLLNPAVVPELYRAAMLVELHDHFNAGVSDRIRRRFEGTHDLRTFQTRERTLNDLPTVHTMTQERLEALVVEQRGVTQSFFLLMPRSR